MRHRILAIVTVAALGIGALALIPGGARPTVATAEAEPTQMTLASVSSPNPELLRRLDNEVAPPPVQPAAPEPTRVAAVSPAPATAALAPATAAPDLAASSMVEPNPNLKSDVVGSSAVNLRSGPSTSAPPISVLQPGEAIQVGESSGGWVKVTRADGSTGWVYSSYLASNARSAASDSPPQTRVASTAQPRAVIRGGAGDLEDRTARIASRLPAYARPNDGAQSVFMLQPGDEVYIAEVRGSWLRVETEDGMTAWIRR
ncbi:MAG TPA: SH3 domain-containing protein [Devosia sp.]|jgi:SH3-like domain-containing protein|nr:SH3 domain-containing protein [Devosia sp.]